MAATPDSFEYQIFGSDVVIRHHGRTATTLRADASARFLADIETHDPQSLVARITGNYKRGNERAARKHPRNSAG